MIPSSNRLSAVTSVFLTLFNILNVTSVYVFAWILVNPLFGNLLYNGVCPPSNPRLTPPPLLAFCPLCPFPDVFPFPEPIPRPTLFLFTFFTAGFKSSSFISGCTSFFFASKFIIQL